MGLRPALLLLSAFAALAGAAAPAGADDAEVAYDLWRRGDRAAALAASARAVEREDAPASAWKVRAYVLSRDGRKPEAAEAYRRAVGKDPRDPVARNNLGAVLLDLGRVEEALAEFEGACRLAPEYADAWNNRGVALERLGRLDDAVRSYRSAATDRRTHAAAMNNLGAIAWRRGYEDRARGAFARASQLDPELLAPAVNLTLVRGAAGSAPSAAPFLEAARQPSTDPELRARILAALAAKEVAAERFEAARALYLEALALRPEDAALLNNLGVVEDRLGLDREAILRFEAALEEDPALLVARNNVGIVHAHRGAMETAAEVFAEVIAKDPSFGRAHYNLGVVMAARGHLTEAQRSLRQAATLRPTDASVRYNLALVEARLGSGVEAERRGYEAALALDPALAEPHLALGGLLADPNTPPALRDETRARALLERFLALAKADDADGRSQAQGWIAYLNWVQR